MHLLAAHSPPSCSRISDSEWGCLTLSTVSVPDTVGIMSTHTLPANQNDHEITKFVNLTKAYVQLQGERVSNCALVIVNTVAGNYTKSSATAEM